MLNAESKQWSCAYKDAQASETQPWSKTALLVYHNSDAPKALIDLGTH